MTTLKSTFPAETTSEMSYGRWVRTTLGLIALLAVANILIAWRMDIFGIFRDPHGRSLITSKHERKAKYLLNQAYVPANFDALIVGASASVNWQPSKLTGHRFYNESVEGGDASEERRIVEQALPHGHFKVALIALNPRITGLHLLQDGFDKVTWTEALGSVSTLGVEYDILVNHILHTPPEIFADGSRELPPHAPPKPDSAVPIREGMSQDPLAVADYKALVQEILGHGTRIIYVVSPLYGPSYAFNRNVMLSYMKSVKDTMPPAPIIDFNGPEYTSFCNDATNFIDQFHLSRAGSDTVSQWLNTLMHKILRDQ